MKLINQIIEGEYTINVYDNGAREKFLTEFPPKIVQPPILTESEERQVQTLLGVETLLVMQELQSGLTY